MTSNKLFKTLIKVVLIASVLVAGVVWFLLSAEKASPDALQAEEEAYRESWGYNQRIQELVELSGMSETNAQYIIDTLLDTVGLPEILSIEKAEGGLKVKTNYYTATVKTFGRDVDNVKIGKALIYRRLEPDKTQIIVDKLYSYAEINTKVERLAKALKLDKNKAAELFMDLTNIDIFDFSNIKKGKSKDREDKLEKVFLGLNNATPIKVVLRNDRLERVYISGLDYKEIGDILVYDRNLDGEQSFKNNTIVTYSRTNIPESLGYQVGQHIDATVRFPVALANGDDSWVIVKLDDDTIYFEANGDITREGKTESAKVIGIRSGSNEYKYLKVGRKVIIK